jgi:hypothetical protein
MMYASVLDTIQVVELVVVTLAAGGGIGVGLGRFTKRAFKTKREEDIKFREEHKAITEALLGVPASQWEPAHAGLISAMIQVQSLYADLEERTIANESWIRNQDIRQGHKIQDNRSVPDTPVGTQNVLANS